MKPCLASCRGSGGLNIIRTKEQSASDQSRASEGHRYRGVKVLVPAPHQTFTHVTFLTMEISANHIYLPLYLS